MCILPSLVVDVIAAADRVKSHGKTKKHSKQGSLWARLLFSSTGEPGPHCRAVKLGVLHQKRQHLPIKNAACALDVGKFA